MRKLKPKADLTGIFKLENTSIASIPIEYLYEGLKKRLILFY